VAFPTTVPILSTDAINVLLLDQVPPVEVFASVVEPPMQVVAKPVMGAGEAFTDTNKVAGIVQPVL
jgi:hypothetical protein